MIVNDYNKMNMKKLLLLCQLCLLTGSALAEGNIVSFSVKYWTVDGQTHILSEGIDQVLTVPAEAVAVDLRGVSMLNTVFTVDHSQANPNCLYFLNRQDYVQGLDGTNMVRDNEAACISVKDGYPFYSPMSFNAQYISYLLVPQPENLWMTSTGSPGFSETLVLPFSAKYALYNDINGDAGSDNGFESDNLYVCRYVSHSEDQVQFERVADSSLQAYQPYLLLSHLLSRLLFFAVDTEVPATRDAVTHDDGLDFVGSTTGLPTPNSGYLFWNGGQHCFSPLVEVRLLQPFRCCMVMGQEATGIDQETPASTTEGAVYHLMVDNVIIEQPTSITHHRRESDIQSHFYNLLGVREAQPMKGLYISGGRKVVVR